MNDNDLVNRHVTIWVASNKDIKYEGIVIEVDEQYVIVQNEMHHNIKLIRKERIIDIEVELEAENDRMYDDQYLVQERNSDESRPL